MAQRPQGSVEILSACVAAFLISRLRYHFHGEPARAGVVHRNREAMWDLVFGDSGARSKDKRASLRYSIVSHWLHGDVFKKHVDFWAGGKGWLTESHVKAALRGIVAPALVHIALQ